MKSKTAIALAAVLSTSLFAAPAISHAESGTVWLMQQLQMTDGYAPPPPAASSGSSTYEGAAVTVNPAQSDWVVRQLQMTDGYAPPPVARAKDEKGTVTSAHRGVSTTQN